MVVEKKENTAKKKDAFAIMLASKKKVEAEEKAPAHKTPPSSLSQPALPQKAPDQKKRTRTKPKLPPKFESILQSVRSHSKQMADTFEYVKECTAKEKAREARRTDKTAPVTQKATTEKKGSTTSAMLAKHSAFLNQYHSSNRHIERSPAFYTNLSKPMGFMDIVASFDAREAEYRESNVQRVSTTIRTKIANKCVHFLPFDQKMLSVGPAVFYSSLCMDNDSCCMWCTGSLGGLVPLPVCRKYEDHTRSFYVTGQFCTPHCMLAYATKNNMVYNSRFMLAVVYQLSYKVEVKNAPSPFLLKKFGGTMTIDTFRASCATVKLDYTLVERPMVPFYSGVQETERTVTVVEDKWDNGDVREYILRHHENQIHPRSSFNPSKRFRVPRQPFGDKDFVIGMGRGRKRGNKVRPVDVVPITEQLKRSATELKAEREALGIDTQHLPQRKKVRTLMDFMKVEKKA